MIYLQYFLFIRCAMLWQNRNLPSVSEHPNFGNRRVPCTHSIPVSWTECTATLASFRARRGQLARVVRLDPSFGT
jgi:hypothetical protein